MWLPIILTRVQVLQLLQWSQMQTFKCISLLGEKFGMDKVFTQDNHSKKKVKVFTQDKFREEIKYLNYGAQMGSL